MTKLAQEIEGFIIDKDAGSFEHLLVKLFQYQFDSNLPYRRLCTNSGISPHSIDNWRDVPAAPALAFRLFDLSCQPIDVCPVVFYSSGTTSTAASRHWMDHDALKLYHVSLRTGFEREFSNYRPLMAVMQDSSDAPHSSLSHMLHVLESDMFVGNDVLSFSDLLAAAASEGNEVTVFGTAFGLLELLKIRCIQLPTGSRVIETGGFKGRVKEISRSEFYAALRSGFGVRDESCYGEYGMCEMASQYYSRSESGTLHSPHWLRARCINPLTGDDASIGEPGLMRHYDLANYNSVSVIQTQDRGVMYEDGSFQLIGRATDAELRGCSLTAEELWSS